MQKNKVTLVIEPLEARIAPTAASGNPAGVFYAGDGLHTPGGVVEQSRLSGDGFDSSGRADFDGALVRVFKTDDAPALGRP